MLASGSMPSPSRTGARNSQELPARVAGVLPGGLPRLLAVFAHPDDEVLALGARLERWRDALFVCVTDGAPTDGADARAHGFGSLEEYREARRNELHAALAHAGVPASSACALQVARGASVAQIADQQTALHLVAVTRALTDVMRSFQPEVVLTHPYEGGHPDHDSCAFAVHAAARMLGDGAPPIVEAPSYFAGAEGLVTGSFLPQPGAGEAVASVLSEAEREAKRARLSCFRSQGETLAQFACDSEQFRLAPHYDFSQSPHAGVLFYERFSWGMSGERFRVLARAAAEELGIGGEGT